MTVGTSVGAAFVRMYYLERACRVQKTVLGSGRPVRLPPVEIRERAARQSERFPPGTYEWPALLRLADQLDPSYRS